MGKKNISYKDSGVDIAKSNRTKRLIKRLVKSTYTSQVLAEFGSFGGLFKLPSKTGRSPVLVSSVDGVGTKLKIAFALNKHDTVGIDIVSHCCNDILVQGAQPLFFMDYIAMGKHHASTVHGIIKGLVRGCRDNGCVLLGGEMAEMPGFYRKGEYDLAGMIVGWVKPNRLIDGSKIKPGNVILGIASNGLHTNGYSLARKVLLGGKRYGFRTFIKRLKTRLGDALLKPHKSYVASIMGVLEKYPINGLAHITGGGMPDNIIRILPPHCIAVIRQTGWSIPPLFSLIQDAGNISLREMRRVFNMGIGMVAVVDSKWSIPIAGLLQKAGEKVYTIGEIEKGQRQVYIN